VSSAVPQEGKTTTAVNLAVSISDSGARVVLVEADLRRPVMASRLGVTASDGLTTVLSGAATLSIAVVQYRNSSLYFLPSGPIPPNPSELLGSESMERVLEELRAQYDYVVVDSPPLLPVTDAAVLSPRADGVLLVVGAGIARREFVQGSLDRLGAVGGHVFGIVLNRVPQRGADAPAYYGPAYAYSSDLEESRSRST
jgi:capsular exopolysaccharide synthesis family protein